MLRLSLIKPFNNASIKQSLIMNKRLLSIKTLSTPNENAIKFEVDQNLTNKSLQLNKTSNYNVSPLAKKIFNSSNDIDSLMIGSNFVTVNKNEFAHWNQVTPIVQTILHSHLLSNEPVINESELLASNASQANRSHLSEDDQEVSDMVEELIETRIKPAIQDDGGDIVFIRYEDGKVYVQLQGACTSCSLSDDTLKSGIQSMLSHYIEGIDEVVNLAEVEFHKFEEKLQKQRSVTA